MDEASAALRDAFVDAYLPYVEAHLKGMGVEVAPHFDALRNAQISLAAALDALLNTRYSQQRRGPLELFQEAMAVPTTILQEAGVEPLQRDEVAQAALPGDLYGLAPASSRSLGEEVWEAHLRWGATKAAALQELDER